MLRILARPASRKLTLAPPKQITRTMQIEAIPMWTGTGDNYAYLVVDDATKDAMLVDPAHPPEVLPVLQQRIADGVTLRAIINTHHHGDHAGGNADVLAAYPGTPVIGGRDCALKTKTPAHGEEFKIGEHITARALHTPCHTQDSICYHLHDAKTAQNAVLTGDTLFVGGCGRFFEGSAEEMHAALNKILAALPDDTVVYPGHEYTKSNMRFVKSVLGEDEEVEKVVRACGENGGVTTGRFTIADEKRYNVFMMLGDERVKKATGEESEVGVMKKLREMKNNFKEDAAPKL